MIRYNIKIALKRLLRFKSHTVISLLGLVLGLTSVFVIAAWTYQELHYDRFHDRAESIFMVTTDIRDANGDLNSFPETPPPLARELKTQIPGIEHSFHMIYLYGGRMLKTDNDTFKETGIAADSKFFDVLDFDLVVGNPNVLNDPDVILLTKKLSEKLFPNELSIGKSLIYENNRELTVKGIIGDIPENSSLQFDYIISYDIEGGNQDEWWQLSDVTFIKINQHADVSQTKQLAQTIWRERIADDQYNLNLIPITTLRFGAKFPFFNAEHGSLQKLYIFICVAALILVLACLNYINLIAAYAIKRKKEVGIRKVNGADTRTLIAYFLTESMLLSSIAWLLASILSWTFIDLFQSILDVRISYEYLKMSIAAGFIVSLLVVGLFSGLYPAFLTSSFHSFKKSAPGHHPVGVQRPLTNTFLLSQFVLSISLTIACLILLRQTNYLKNYDVGYSQKNIVQIHLPGDKVDRFKSMKYELVSHPEIEHISFARVAPVSLPTIFTTENWRWEGLNQSSYTSVYRLYVDHAYLDVFQIPLAKGHFFTPSSNETSKVVINQTMAELMGVNDPTGHYISLGEDQYEIIGLVEDFNFQHLSNTIKPLLFMYDDAKNRMFVKTNQQTGQALKTIRDRYEKLTAQPFSFSFIEDNYNDLYKSESKITVGIAAFTFLTIFLSCIGLIGLITYNTETKKKEIAVRKVCGAKINEIMVLLIQSLVKWFLIGSVISSLVAWFAMNKWLENFANRVGLVWWVFVSGAAIMMIITILTVSWQTWRAAIKNPVEALKYE